MSIERLRAHWGFTKMPFGKDLAPSMLHSHKSHAEAVARMGWCIEERVTGLVTGEVGSGKSVAVRSVLSSLDASRNTVVYLGDPSVGLRGMYAAIVTTLGGVPRFHRGALIPQAAEALETEESERGRRVTIVVDLCRRCFYADRHTGAVVKPFSSPGFVGSAQSRLSA